MDNLDTLSSDGENAVQNGDNVKFVGNVREGTELELENKELMFKFCSDGCMDKVVIACFESTDSNDILQGDCAPGQCMFKAGVSKDRTYGTKHLWFMSDRFSTKIVDLNGKCATATMAFPDASSTFTDDFLSCEPLKHDGNVVKLYVKHVGCPFYVLNAKKWIPPTTTTATQNSSSLSEANQTTSKSSEANTSLWIGIGVGIFILLIVIIGFGYCCYRTQIQKQPLFGKKKDVQQKVFLPEASKKANVVKEK
uniref:Uncharacterized protein n=1 Tax=Panagrolaimus sp. PS1159 TaxID=55785 RepID=A0AC35GPK3_9BILA